MARIMENGRPSDLRRLEELIKLSKDLVKHSDRLNFWTKVIIGTSAVLILSAIAQIVVIILVAKGIIT